MLEEIRIGSLGVIEASTLELGPGLTVITGETGAGKTMIVTALGLLLGGRSDSGAVRSGARTARVEGVVHAAPLPSFTAAVEEAGGEVEDGRVVLARNVSAEGRSRAFVGGATVPVSTLAGIAEPLVAVHGQSDQHRLLQARAQREALDRFGGRGAGRSARPPTPTCTSGSTRPSASSTTSSRPPATAPGRPTCSASASGRSRRSSPSRARTPRSPPRRPGWASPTRCGPPRSRPGRRCPASRAPPTRSRRRRPPADCSTACASTTRGGELADRLAEVTYLLSDVAADVASYAARVDTDPARLATVSERRAALTALTRKYGDTIDEVLAWAAQSAQRLFELDGTDDRIDRAPGPAAAAASRSSPRPAAALSAARTEGRRAARGSRHRRARPAGDAARPADHRGPPARVPPPGGIARGPRRSRSAGCASPPPASTRSSCCSLANTGAPAASAAQGRVRG